jgi:hypothetical protein
VAPKFCVAFVIHQIIRAALRRCKFFAAKRMPQVERVMRQLVRNQFVMGQVVDKSSLPLQGHVTAYVAILAFYLFHKKQIQGVFFHSSKSFDHCFLVGVIDRYRVAAAMRHLPAGESHRYAADIPFITESLRQVALR